MGHKACSWGQCVCVCYVPRRITAKHWGAGRNINGENVPKWWQSTSRKELVGKRGSECGSLIKKIVLWWERQGGFAAVALPSTCVLRRHVLIGGWSTGSQPSNHPPECLLYTTAPAALGYHSRTHLPRWHWVMSHAVIGFGGFPPCPECCDLTKDLQMSSIGRTKKLHVWISSGDRKSPWLQQWWALIVFLWENEKEMNRR